jgi:cyclic-di-AMP phosphodiesterase PgpH
MSRRDYLLVLLLAMSAPLLVVISRLEFTSLPAVGLLVSTFYGSLLGGTVVILMTLLMLLGLEMGVGQLAAIAIGSLVGSLFARQPRSRDELALLGLIVALVQGLVYFLILSATGGVWYVVVGAAIRQGVLGLLWTIATLGISPYLEHLFDLVTPIRLAELANPNRPLLKRLAMESPGTFQHTLLVATLAEAGARGLGCNVELVRTGTLYHDIGKLHDPQAFIENQFGIDNVHDALDNPWESADIIKKHVTEGLVMARRARLPSAVQAFIPEHQGKILIAFFHHQAQKKAAEQLVTREVLEADFRYDGPIPQSRETGIVMLADACEAALRSLKDATPEVARRTINKIFKARWEDQQLVDSGLSRADLSRLEDVFIEVWQQFHHKRVSYPNRLLNR